ncbi:MAG: RibD family protein, partial [Gammaproteobacteria bacterium]|nr:RibD family protein [Gammaproteobacteria bacterium]
ITGEHARRDVQLLRARSEAILTGTGTVRADNPSLNVRLSSEELGIEQNVIQPLRVVVDSELKTPADARMFSLDGPILLVSGHEGMEQEQKLTKAGAEFVCCPGEGGRVDLEAMLKELASREVNEVHVEAGEKLCGSLLENGLVDEVIIYMAGHIMGSSGKGLFDMPSIQSMSQRKAMKIIDIRAVGDDWRITARPEH